MKGEPLYEGAVCAIKGAVFERGKLVITTDGAPAWGDGNDYGGRLKGYRDVAYDERVRLLSNAIRQLTRDSTCLIYDRSMLA